MLVDLNQRSFASRGRVEGRMPLGTFSADRLRADLASRPSFSTGARASTSSREDCGEGAADPRRRHLALDAHAGDGQEPASALQGHDTDAPSTSRPTGSRSRTASTAPSFRATSPSARRRPARSGANHRRLCEHRRNRDRAHRRQRRRAPEQSDPKPRAVNMRSTTSAAADHIGRRVTLTRGRSHINGGRLVLDTSTAAGP